MKIDNLFDLSGKTAIITGGANGIGKASAQILAKAGANIVIGDLNLSEAQAVATEISQIGVKAIAVECNILKDDQLVQLVDRAVAEFGSIHILVNNAGGGGRENPAKISIDDIRHDYELNVFSGWRLSQLCVPHMKNAGYGSIIFTTSMASINKSPNMSGYAG